MAKYFESYFNIKNVLLKNPVLIHKILLQIKCKQKEQTFFFFQLDFNDLMLHKRKYKNLGG